ncbi:hypothetical protein LOC68_16835 [Blastopirellula sp. JC732]|uniref:Uncharacterized protein n=1 Tax=Blastopirellula sediminis TaxID=2894196 RepID=A0A9X1MPM7_9BACT|nr:hypothetical protein [Blastopirellula sediminis]MCC9606643.1 hypothetical protein [Blastopirellula sediminis]MCC9630060.1 hypothetical protein [Blastopirellula sediminis]
MPIEFACQVCKQQIRVPDGNEGKRTKCPHCSAVQPIPGGAPPSGGNLFSDPNPYNPPADQSSSLFPDSVTAPPAGESNPFASPYASSSSSAYSMSGGFEEAKKKVAIPAIVCMSLLGIILALMLLGLVANVVMIAANNNNIQRDPAELIGNLIGSGLVIAFNAFTLFSLYNAVQLRNYALAWTGFILALLPCSSSLCCIFVMPFAIWGMVVISDAEVQRQFQG